MGYTLFAYLIDLDLLTSTFGSKNDDLAIQIIESCTQDIQDADSFIVDDDGESAMSIDHAILDIVHGTVGSSEESERYGYALECVCGFLGEELPNDQVEGLNSGVFNVFDAIPDIKRLMLSDQPYPIPIPPIRYLPCIAYITDIDARHQLSNMEVDWSKINTLQREYADRVIHQYRLWLQRSVETKEGIVIFYY